VLISFPRKTKAVSIVVAATILMSACVTTADNSQVVAGRGDDVCVAQAVSLNESQTFFAEDLLAGVVTGAATGALTGALGAALTGGNVGKAAAQGAVGGAVAAAAGADWQKRMGGGRAEALLGVKKDIQRETDQLNRTNAAFKELSNCRKAQFAAIKGDFKAKKITKAEADQRWARQRELLQRDIELANSINANVVKRGESFAYANEQVNGGAAAKQSKDTARIQTASANTKVTSTKKDKVKPVKAEDSELQSAETSRQVSENSNGQITQEIAGLGQATAGGLDSNIG
jgi:hypothetical protein